MASSSCSALWKKKKSCYFSPFKRKKESYFFFLLSAKSAELKCEPGTGYTGSSAGCYGGSLSVSLQHSHTIYIIPLASLNQNKFLFSTHTPSLYNLFPFHQTHEQKKKKKKKNNIKKKKKKNEKKKGVYFPQLTTTHFLNNNRN